MIIRVAGYEDKESANTEVVPRAEPRTSLVDMCARGSVDPKELHTECRGNTSVHTSPEGLYMTDMANQPAKGVLHKAPSREVSDSEIFNSPDCLVSMQVTEVIPPNDFQVQLQVIDDELAKFDQRAEKSVAGSVAMSSVVVAQIVESTGFLKKLFTSAGSSKNGLVVQKVSRLGRQQSVNSREMKKMLSKRLRQNSDEESEEKCGHRKKRASTTFI